MTPADIIRLFQDSGVRLELGPSGKSVLQRPAGKAPPPLLMVLRDNRVAVLDELRHRAGLPPRWPPVQPKRTAVPPRTQAASRPAPFPGPPWASMPSIPRPVPPAAPPAPPADEQPWGLTDCGVCRTTVFLETRPLLGRNGELAYGTVYLCGTCAWTHFRGGRPHA